MVIKNHFVKYRMSNIIHNLYRISHIQDMMLQGNLTCKVLPFLLLMVAFTRFELATSYGVFRQTSRVTPTRAGCWGLKNHRQHTYRVSHVVVRSSADDETAGSGDEAVSSYPSPPITRANAPSPAPSRILDPLMDTLTRVDSATANLPTRNIPFFGEVPADGSLLVLVPAAFIAVLGFVLSIVVAINSKDAIVATLSQVSNELSQTAVSKSSKAYDDGVCRGICSSQQEDLEGLKTFLNRLKKD